MPELFYKQDGHAYKKPTLHLAANVIKYTKKREDQPREWSSRVWNHKNKINGMFSEFPE
jgi:hypothetical protein